VPATATTKAKKNFDRQDAPVPAKAIGGPTVAFDARWLFTGIGTYIFNVLSRIKRIEPELRLHAITGTQFQSRLRPFCDRMSVVNVPIYTLREQIEVPWAARGDQLLHVPHYNAPLLRRGRLVVTVHDLTHLLDATYRSKWKVRLFGEPLLKQITRRADHFFAVTEYTKRRMMEHLNVPAGKITVAYNAASPEFRPQDRQIARAAVRAAFSLDGPYILYVGNLKPHKNVACLLRAAALLRNRRLLEHKLAILGGGREGLEELRKLAAQLGIAGQVVFPGAVSQELLARAYCAADVLVLPSFEEGFGLPVVEAMACGTPVICARAASLPEVAADAAQYFDPRSPEDLAGALDYVLHSAFRSAELRSRGFARASKFTWEKCAAVHCAVYRRLMG
jgi:glycosyltransferase involved in cell wall biosynthesis